MSWIDEIPVFLDKKTSKAAVNKVGFIERLIMRIKNFWKN